MIDSDRIHLHQNRLNREFNVFLLLIPAIVFTILLVSFLYLTKKNAQYEQVSSENIQNNTLGETDTIDIK